MSEILYSAQKHQELLCSQIANSPSIQSQRPLFHFSTPGGWCNDPNGFSQFDGKIHLFYQFHPYSTQWGPMHWGHVTSSDFIQWENQKVALAPDSPCDQKGCFSGTAVEYQGRHLVAYTGVVNQDGKDIQNQCMAFGNGSVYEKINSNPVITKEKIPFDYDTEHFRDPKIFVREGKIYMLCVIKQLSGRGAMVLFDSTDAINWNYKGMVDHSKDGLSRMWECPDFTELDGHDILIFSPQEVMESDSLGFHKGNNSVYVTGKMDFETALFTRHRRVENDYTAALIDYGIDFYAPETTKLADGRTIMMAWMQAWESYITPPEYIWSGMMTIPREISIRENRLYQMPVRELNDYTKLELEETIPSGSEKEIFSQKERRFVLDVEIENSESGIVEMYLSSGKERIALGVNLYDNSIYFDRQHSLTPGAIPQRKALMRFTHKKLSAKILVDTCSVELFLNQGVMAFTNTFFFSSPLSDLRLVNSTIGKVHCAYSTVEVKANAE